MERAREWVTALLNDVWHSAVVKSGCVSSRVLRIKFKFSRVKVCILMAYGSNEGDGEERERLWNNVDRTLDIIGSGSKWMNRG